MSTGSQRAQAQARLLQPKSRHHAPAAESPSTDHKPAKRRCVPTACIPCRKRKSKCDGGTPVCSTCTAVYKTECSYDEAADGRRRASSTKRANDDGRESSESLEMIMTHLKNCPRSELWELVEQIRGDENLDALAASLKQTLTLDRPVKHESDGLEGEFQLTEGRHSLRTDGQVPLYARSYGHTSSLGLVASESEPSMQSPQNAFQQGAWTNVTVSSDFIEHLFRLYFTWQHPFYVVFEEDKFWHSYRTRDTKYCSSLLVNAICAYACHFSDLPQAYEDPNEPKTAGNHFFAEAKRLLYENDRTCLTSAQALAVMGLREASAGRESNGFQYQGRALRMLVELGLHLPFYEVPENQFSASELENRKVMFWGHFALDTIWSVCIGRMSQLPKYAVGVDRPTQSHIKNEWAAYSDQNLSKGVSTPVRCDNRQFFLHLSMLAEVVNDNLEMFYAPRERTNVRRLIDRYRKYQAWYKILPDSLQLNNDSPPHFYTLHMFYHTCICLLFRPFVRTDFVAFPDIKPRDIVISSASEVAALMETYRNRFGLRCGNILLAHILLTACTVYLMDLPSKGYSNLSDRNRTAIRNISQGLRDLAALSKNHVWAARCFRLVCGLAEQWQLYIPDDAFDENSPSITRPSISPGSNLLNSQVAVSNAEIHASMTEQQQRVANAMNPYVDQSSRLSRANQPRLAQYYAQSYPYSTVDSPTGIQAAYDPLTSSITTNYPNPTHSTDAYLSPTTPTTACSVTSASASAITSAIGTLDYTTATADLHTSYLSNSHDGLLWTPFAGQCLPLMHTQAGSSPMDLTNLLGDVSVYDQFSRDGFRISETWGSDPVLGAAMQAAVSSQHQQQQQVAMTTAAAMASTPVSSDGNLSPVSAQGGQSGLGSATSVQTEGMEGVVMGGSGGAAAAGQGMYGGQQGWWGPAQR